MDTNWLSLAQRPTVDSVDCSLALCVGSTHQSFDVCSVLSCLEEFITVRTTSRDNPAFRSYSDKEQKGIFKKICHTFVADHFFIQLRCTSMCDNRSDRKLEK